MPLIESIRGYAETPVGGDNYRFELDRAGRYVCRVTNMRHVQILLAAQTYRMVEQLPEGPVAAPEGPDLDALRADLLNSVNPKVLAVPKAEGQHDFYVIESWPELTALPIDEIEHLPICCLIDPNERLQIRVLNGLAIYALKGTVPADDGRTCRIYVLTPGSEIDLTKVPSEAPADSGASDATGIVPGAADGASDGDDDETEGPDLIDIKGIGAKLVEKLENEGIETLEDLVALTPEQLVALDAKLGTHGAIERDKWIEQAKALLAAEANE